MRPDLLTYDTPTTWAGNLGNPILITSVFMVTRSGKRGRAGRPPLAVPTQPVQVRMTPDLAKRLRMAQAEEACLTYAELITLLLDDRDRHRAYERAQQAHPLARARREREQAESTLAMNTR